MNLIAYSYFHLSFLFLFPFILSRSRCLNYEAFLWRSVIFVPTRRCKYDNKKKVHRERDELLIDNAFCAGGGLDLFLDTFIESNIFPQIFIAYISASFYASIKHPTQFYNFFLHFNKSIFAALIHGCMHIYGGTWSVVAKFIKNIIVVVVVC